MGPAVERWKGKMQSSGDVEETGGNTQGLHIYCTRDREQKEENEEEQPTEVVSE